jgi:hypothetical protein
MKKCERYFGLKLLNPSMTDKQLPESPYQDIRLFGVEFPDTGNRGDRPKIENESRLCNHIYHVYHIHNIENIHQIYHARPPVDNSLKPISGGLKTSLEEKGNHPSVDADPMASRVAYPSVTPITKLLKVPYCNQLGLADGQRYWLEGFSASSAMLAMYWGKEPTENVYDKLRNRYVDSSTSQAQLDALRSLGLSADFHTDGTTTLLKQEIDAGRPVAVGWLCDGPVFSPSGGGHWSVIIGYDDTGLFMNDPYGNCDLVDGGYLSHHDGAGLHYPYQNWVPRWRVEGTGGWMLTSCA